jgi:competence protein ComEC
MRAPATGSRLAALILAWQPGVAIQSQERSLLPWPVYAALASVAALALVAGFVWRRRAAFGAGIAVTGALVAGFALTGWQASVRLDDAFAPALEGPDIVVTGVVASLPQQGPSGLRFRFEIDPDSRAREGGLLPQRIALGWYNGFDEDATLSQPQRELRAGQRWRLAVRLRRPHGNLNPHGFD